MTLNLPDLEFIALQRSAQRRGLNKTAIAKAALRLLATMDDNLDRGYHLVSSDPETRQTTEIIFL